MYDPKKAHYVVATAIIVKDGKFLIAKRAPHEKVSPNEWTVPGGKLELGDYNNRKPDTSFHWYNIFEDLLRREVMEEVALSIKNINYLTSLAFIRPDGVPVIVASFFADYAGGDVKLCPDLTEYAWVDTKEAKSYALIEGIYEELVMLDKILKGKSIKSWNKELRD